MQKGKTKNENNKKRKTKEKESPAKTSGCNEDRRTMMPPENINSNEWADFWRNQIGVNVIPANSKTKKPKVEWKQWQDKPIPEEIHNEWKSKGMFDEGHAIVCGQTFHDPAKEGLWLNGIDCDNKMAIDEVCPSGIKKIAEMTIVEQHANREKCHILFYTKKPIQSQARLQGENIPQIEIKSGGKFLLYCAGCIHRDGSPIKIIGSRQIKIIEDKKLLEERIDDVFRKHNMEYLKRSSLSITEFQKPLYEVNQKLHEGSNRGIHILSYLDSKKIKNPELDEDDLFSLARKYEKENCVGKYDDSKISELVKEAISYGEQKISEHTQLKDSDDHGVSKVTKNKDTIDRTSVMIKNNHHFITIRKTNEILLFNGKIYSNDDAESIIREETESIIDNCTTHERNEVVNKIKAQTGANNEEFDNDPNLQTLENGILDLERIELSQHTSKNLSKVLLPVNFDRPEFDIRDESIFEDIESNLSDTLFWKFLKRSFTIDGKFQRKSFETILEIAASFLVKRQIDEKIFMNLGNGENGKSVFLEYMESMLGKDNIEHIQLQDLEEDKFMCAKLEGKLANIFPDLEPNELRHTGKIKAIASNEGIEVQNKYQPAFKLYPFLKMMFSCNRFPKAHDQGQGFFRRWIIIKWERNFENDPERDERLKEKLRQNREETDKVFSSLVYLARKILARGKFTHSKDWRDVQREWNANADPIDDFATNYIVDSDSHKTKRETYQFYKETMLSRSETPLGIGRFGKLFAEYFEDSVERVDKGRTMRVWLNIAFKKPQQVELEEFQ